MCFQPDRDFIALAYEIQLALEREVSHRSAYCDTEAKQVEMRGDVIRYLERYCSNCVKVYDSDTALLLCRILGLRGRDLMSNGRILSEPMGFIYRGQTQKHRWR